MAITPPALVMGAPRTPLPFGLFSAVPFRENSADRWEGGIQFESIGCPGDLKGVGALDCDNGETVGLPKDLDEGGQVVSTADPFIVYETYQCTPIGNTLEHAQDIARQRLEAREEMRVEQALSTGAFGQSPNFAEEDAVTELGVAGSLREALAAIEQIVATEYGSQGILHMSRYTAMMAIGYKLLEANGQRLRTKLGTPVIAGTGYTFDGIYATPAMFGYRSEVLPSSNRAGDLLDRSSNDLYGIAERNYLLAMDDCGIWHVDVADEGPALSSRVAALEESSAQHDGEIEGLDSSVTALGADLERVETTANGKVSSVGAGDGIEVDSTDAQNPVVSATPPASSEDGTEPDPEPAE